jgi:hypothetical protein
VKSMSAPPVTVKTDSSKTAAESKKVMRSMRRHAAVKGSLFCAELPCILEKRQGVWTIVQLRDALKNSAARLN